MSFFEVFFDYWWMLLFIPLPYFSYFVFNLYQIKKGEHKAEAKKSKKAYLYEPILTEEKKYLDIEIENDDIPFYKKRIESLVENLLKTKGTITISSIEAMLLVELYSDSVVITEDGEFVININTAKKFSKTIMENPKKFIAYIKSLEKKVDVNNKSNKVELGEVLYMMRNARKFGLNIAEKKEDNLIFKVTSAIHENKYSDVVIKIVDPHDMSDIDDILPQNNHIILQNISSKNENDAQPSDLQSNSSVESFEKLDDGKIKITLKNGMIITKDDLMIFDVQIPEVEDEGRANKENNLQKDFIDLNTEEDTEVDEYKSLFGELSAFEKKNIEKRLFKYRAKWFFDMQLYGIRNFSNEQFSTENIFDKKNIFIYFVAQLFNQEYAIKNHLPHIFIGDMKLRNKEPMRFITIDIHYLLVNLYLLIDRENKESFFKFCYNGKKINNNNVNILLSNINMKHQIFFHEKENFLYDSVYSYKTQTIKTKIIRVEIDNFSELLSNYQDLNKNYKELKKIVYENVIPKSFGEAAKKAKADVDLDATNLFREYIDQKPF